MKNVNKPFQIGVLSLLLGLSAVTWSNLVQAAPKTHAPTQISAAKTQVDNDKETNDDGPGKVDNDKETNDDGPRKGIFHHKADKADVGEQGEGPNDSDSNHED